MGERRSGRSETLPSAAAFLDELAPARRAISGAMAHVTISGPAYTALGAAMVALDKLAADLGHPNRLMPRGH